MQETDLFEPIKNYFEKNDYEVRGEIKNCDLVATKDDDIIIVELKKSINLKLVLQAIERQKISESVYVCVPKTELKKRNIRELIRLLKRLELGLLTVDLKKKKKSVDLHFHPIPYSRKKSSAKKRSVIKEIAERPACYNTGGTTKSKIVTGYRLKVIKIARTLQNFESATPSQLRKEGCSDKAGQILYQNHYNWFERIGHGTYKLSANGIIELKNFDHIDIE
jgi:hypothetical protein